jgi:hypothetical protein
MFDAPTKELLAEIARRQSVMRYLVWNDSEVGVQSIIDATQYRTSGGGSADPLDWPNTKENDNV